MLQSPLLFLIDALIFLLIFPLQFSHAEWQKCTFRQLMKGIAELLHFSCMVRDQKLCALPVPAPDNFQFH